MTDNHEKVTLQEYGTEETRWVYTRLDWDYWNGQSSEPYVSPKTKWRKKTKRKIGRWLHDRFSAYCYEGIE